MGALSHRNTFTLNDDRYSQRTRLRLSSVLRFDDAGSVDCVICDVSSTGVLIEVDGVKPLVERVAIDLPGAANIGASAVWNSDGLIGCQFDAPITESRVDEIRQASTVIWPSFGRMNVDHVPAEDRRTDRDLPVDQQQQPVHGWSPRRRLSVVAALAVVSWAAIIGVAALTV